MVRNKSPLARNVSPPAGIVRRGLVRGKVKLIAMVFDPGDSLVHKVWVVEPVTAPATNILVLGESGEHVVDVVDASA
jgi:hypothetical protein